MSTPYSNRNRSFFGALAFLVVIVPWSLAYADKPVEERRPASPNGTVEIVNVAGSVDVVAWDRAEVEVTGKVDDNIERVDLTTDGDRTSIHVVGRGGTSWHGGEAHLHIRVPAASAVSATLVSSDLKLSGIRGDVKLQTVNGDVSGDVGGNLHASTVNGSLRLTAQKAQRTEIKTISGDVTLLGGGGEVEVTTVSGTAKMEFGALTRGRFKSVSGDFSATLALAADAQLDAETVSGDIHIDFPVVPTAAFDVQSFSGDIHNCFGPQPTESHYGPGSRLEFKNGDDHAHVRVETKSGDVRLCAGPHEKKTAMAPVAHIISQSWGVYYVL